MPGSRWPSPDHPTSFEKKTCYWWRGSIRRRIATSYETSQGAWGEPGAGSRKENQDALLFTRLVSAVYRPSSSTARRSTTHLNWMKSFASKEPPTTGVSWISWLQSEHQLPAQPDGLDPNTFAQRSGEFGYIPSRLRHTVSRCVGGGWTDSLKTRNIGGDSVDFTRDSQLSSPICPSSVLRMPRPNSAKSHGAGDHGRDFDVNIRLVVQVQVELQPVLQGNMRCLLGRRSERRELGSGLQERLLRLLYSCSRHNTHNHLLLAARRNRYLLRLQVCTSDEGKSLQEQFG